MSITSSVYTRVKAPAERFLAGDTLRAKVFRGGAWLGLGSVAEQFSRFGRNLVLTRMLAPEAFGMMAIVISVSGLIHTLTDIGVKDAIIQNPRGTEDCYIDAAYWLAFGRALLLAAAICIMAPWAARFYGNPELTLLFQVSSLGVVIDQAGSPRVFADMKRLKFKKWAVMTHGGGISGVIITLTLSFFIRDVWALVIGSVAESVARCILSYALYPYLPSLHWNREAFRDLLQFSKGLAGLSLLNLVFARTDIFVLAKLYPASVLGLYTMAVYLAQTPNGFIINLFSQTLMPTFAHIQGDKARESRILIQVTSAIALLGIPATVFVYFCGHSLITTIYGARYGEASGALVVATLVALINLINSQVTTILYARGLPQLHRRCVMIMAVTMIVLIYPFAKSFGIVGGQLACLVAIIVGYLSQVVRVRQLTGVNLVRYGKPFVLGAGISLTVVVVCLGTRHFPALIRPLPNLAFGILGCTLAYVLSGLYFFRRTEKEFS